MPKRQCPILLYRLNEWQDLLLRYTLRQASSAEMEHVPQYNLKLTCMDTAANRQQVLQSCTYASVLCHLQVLKPPEYYRGGDRVLIPSGGMCAPPQAAGCWQLCDPCVYTQLQCRVLHNPTWRTDLRQNSRPPTIIELAGHLFHSIEGFVNSPNASA